MARNKIRIAAEPSAVWSVLEDPAAYPEWVVGADSTVEADSDWPLPGSTFKVRLAPGNVDETVVREVDPGRRIVLDAAAAIVGPARVTIELEPDGDGTLVTMVEDPAGKMTPLRYLPPVHLAIRLRNVESLRRLRGLAEARQPSPSSATA